MISLQQLQSAGHLVLKEALVDEKLRVSPIQVELDLKYQPPEGAAGTWAEENFGTPIQDNSELIIPNVGFQESELGMTFEGFSHQAWGVPSRLERWAVALGRKLARSLGTQDDGEMLDLELALEHEPDVEISGVVFSPLKSRTLGLPRGDPFQLCRAQDFQVGVTVLEAQKLVGVNIYPYVTVRVGDQRRVTTTQHGTNCPFYNEAFHSQTLPFMATRIGTFRMDLGMTLDQPGCSLYGDRLLRPKSQPLSNVLKGLTPPSIPLSLDGHFHQKWAPLHDPRDTRSGTKGFIKITLSVRARGDLPLPLPPPCPGTSSDIEK
ncbi:Fer-1-like protein 4 [Lemmus lemmus]